MGKCVPLKLIIILFYAHWETKGGLYQNLPINATEIPQLAFGCDRTCPFKADHDLILCTLGKKAELSQNLPGNATGAPQLTYACDRTLN